MRGCHFFGLITLSGNNQHDNVVLGLLCIVGRDPHVGINCKRQIQAAEKQGSPSESQYHIIISYLETMESNYVIEDDNN